MPCCRASGRGWRLGRLPWREVPGPSFQSGCVPGQDIGWSQDLKADASISRPKRGLGPVGACCSPSSALRTALAAGLCVPPRGLGGCARSLPELCGVSVCLGAVHGLNPAAEAGGGLELLAAGGGVSAPAHGAPGTRPFPGRGSCSWHCRLLPDPAGSSCLGSDWLKGKLYAFEGKQRLSELLSSEARSCPLHSPHNSRPAPPVRLSSSQPRAGSGGAGAQSSILARASLVCHGFCLPCLVCPDSWGQGASWRWTMSVCPGGSTFLCLYSRGLPARPGFLGVTSRDAAGAQGSCQGRTGSEAVGPALWYQHHGAAVLSQLQ